MRKRVRDWIRLVSIVLALNGSVLAATEPEAATSAREPTHDHASGGHNHNHQHAEGLVTSGDLLRLLIVYASSFRLPHCWVAGYPLECGSPMCNFSVC